MTIDAVRICDVKKTDVVDREISTDNYNATPGVSWAVLATGAAAAGTGIALVYDARQTYPDDDTSKYYNSTGPDKERLYGYGLIGAGVLFGTSVIVDIVRANGTTVEKTIATLPPTTTQHGVRCQHLPAVGETVVGTIAPGTYDLGRTDDKGRLKIDLDQVIAQSASLTPSSTMVLRIAESMVGTVDVKPLYLKREAEAFERAGVASCRTPTDANSCDGVERFLLAYPDGPHAMEVKSTQDGARPKILALSDERTWSTIDIGRCTTSEFDEPAQVRSACAPVEGYVQQFSNGRHVEEARRALQISEGRARALAEKLAKAEAAELARRLAAEKAAKAKEAAAARRQCVASCRYRCSGSSTRDTAGCFSGCVGSECVAPNQ